MVYLDEEGRLVYEELSTLCGDKTVKQNAALTEASRRQVEQDAEARGIDLGKGLILLSDNKDCEFKDAATILDQELRCRGNSSKMPVSKFGEVCAQCPTSAPAAKPWCMLCFGCPHRGKCKCDATGGRIKALTGQLRQTAGLHTTGPIVDAASQTAGLNEKFREKDGKMEFYAQSRVSEVTADHIKVVKDARAIELNDVDDDASLAGRYPGSKMARCVVYDPETQRIGFRRLWCLCKQCVKRQWSDCELKEFTGGEPTWLERPTSNVPVGVPLPDSDDSD
eukprot:COSAG01_NODE_17765_length_1125_cov_9.555556_2_plen_280_part_00